jgi:peptide/nickel transport system substrate-binding protein
MLWQEDIDTPDPGITWYAPGVQLAYATQKPLFNYKPDDSEHPIPDLADGPARISDDGKTVTVKIKAGVKYSPPYGKVVTSKDVKYAIERGFFSSVNTGYMGTYFGDIEGAKVGVKPGTAIRGIETPDDQTVVFRLTRGTGAALAAAMVMPVTAPVPAAYAAKYDARSTSTYGTHQLATGPYMIRSDATGKTVGYRANRSIDIVRNPSWDKALGFQPAHLDEITIQEGNDDLAVASRQIFEGKGLTSGDWSPPPAVIRDGVTKYKGQMTFVPQRGGRFISLNTSLPPFDDVNVRRAVEAGFNRTALLLARGGKAVGTVPTHWISPGSAGFAESGGEKGFGLDFMDHPDGDPALAASYFKKAGFPSGKYTGNAEVFMVGTSGGVPQKVAEIAKENFEQLGFKVRMRLMSQTAMYTNYCLKPAAKVNACPNLGFYPDYSDPQATLDANFNGRSISPEYNPNPSMLDDPAINKAMDAAELVVGTDARNKAWAEVDRMVTAAVPAINYQWELAPLLASADVRGVPNEFNGVWDLAFSALK